ncbi:MAG: bifunctional phosphoglucose/phosphomannose isomerase [Saprospiraceae bacterium]|nr:bifunctional phosphoglucose/phosphomannose isomerase [Saprospiraceae bacterium]
MVKRFPDQLVEAIEIGENARLIPLKNKPTLIYVSGMGGSGIGADFVSGFVKEECEIPYLINKTYKAPAYINSSSLAIASSYSGNTEETLSNINQCILQGAKIICIASGGKIIDLAKEKGYDYIQVPSNWSSPRACLGYSIVSQLYVLYKLGFISAQFKNDLKKTIELIQSDNNSIQEKANHLANSLYNKTAVIYSTDRIEPVAVRFRQQINENAKRLCWHHVIPEMNHNELVGWRESRPELATIFLRNSDDYPRNNFRTELSKEIIGHFSGVSIDIFSKGNSLIEKSLYLVHLLDYASVFLADLYKVNPVEIKVIDILKEQLSREN